MSAEDLERYETEIELQLYREYRDVLKMFRYVVETERRFYLANDVKLDVKHENNRTYFDLQMRDAWVWDMYREYRDVLKMFRYVVETERRFYLANDVKLDVKHENNRTYFDLQMRDAWVWDMYRPTRFVADVHVVTFKDVNVEELPPEEL